MVRGGCGQHGMSAIEKKGIGGERCGIQAEVVHAVVVLAALLACRVWRAGCQFTWPDSGGPLVPRSSGAVSGVSCSSCKIAAWPLVAVGHIAVPWSALPQIMHRWFLWQCFCSSGFSLPSGPRTHSWVWLVGWLGVVGACRCILTAGLLSFSHMSLHSSCLSQYRLL